MIRLTEEDQVIAKEMSLLLNDNTQRKLVAYVRDRIDKCTARMVSETEPTEIFRQQGKVVELQRLLAVITHEK